LPYDALNLCLFSFDPCKQLCKPHWVGLTCEGFRFLLFFRYYVLCLWVLELCCFVIVFSLFLIFFYLKRLFDKKNPVVVAGSFDMFVLKFYNLRSRVNS
jgi:hypothetical protein